MAYRRLLAVLASASLGVLLSGCVVAPLGPNYAGGYYGPEVYAAPVVVPAPGYYRGHHYGHRGYRGYGGYGYWR